MLWNAMIDQLPSSSRWTSACACAYSTGSPSGPRTTDEACTTAAPGAVNRTVLIS
jgi:hypothetical protein